MISSLQALGVYYDHYGRAESRARYHRFRVLCAESLHHHLRYMWKSPEWCRFFFSVEHIDFVDPIDEMVFMADRFMLPRGHTMVRRREWSLTHPADRLRNCYHLEPVFSWMYPDTIHTLHADPRYQVNALVLAI